MFLLDVASLATIEEVIAYRKASLTSDAHDEYRDGTERAVRDLVAVGVLNLAGRSVYVSQAARETVNVIEGPSPSERRPS